MTNQQQGVAAASSARSTGSSNTSRPLMITKAARMIFSAYRRDDFADPDTFVLQLGIVLERYPDDVIGELSHPLTGIQRRLKKPPSIADIVEGCEEIMARRPAAPRAVLAIEPPVDPAMQARVGELMAGLSKHLHDNQREAREFALKEVEEKQAPRKAAKIRASWERRGLSPPAGLITPELADIVQSWKAAAE